MAELLLSAANVALLARAGLGGVGPYGLASGVVTIRCSRPGMRRNGIAHPAVESYPFDRWTEDELAAFRDDPAFSITYDAVSAVAPGADTADAVQDNGAGPPIPDLGAKPNGTGVSAAVRTATGEVRPALFDPARINAIRGRLVELGVFVRYNDYVAGDVFDFVRLTEEQWVEVEGLVGFRPTIAEMEEALPLYAPAELPLADETIEGDGLAHTSATAPQVPSDRIPSIRAALPQLVAPADFIGGGKPSLEALERLLGWKPQRAEVDAATLEPPAA